MRKTKIGFVILMWNSAHCIDECLRSIVEMVGFSRHVVVVDNGSIDASVRIVESLQDEIKADRDIALELIRLKDNLGTTVSRNIGLRMLESYSPDYYCILDSDTQISENAFLSLIAEMEKHETYGLIGPAMVSRDGALQYSARSFPTVTEKLFKAIPIAFFQKKGEHLEKIIMPQSIEETSFPVDYLMSACWLLRPETLRRVGYLDEHFFYAPEDAEYCIRIWKSGYQVAYCPGAMIVHEWQRLSRNKYFSRINLEHIKGLIYMFWKHHYLFNKEKLKRQ